MKNIYFIGLYALAVAIGISCKKEANKLYSTSSVTVVNAMQNMQDIVVTFSDTVLPYYLNQAPIHFASGIEYGVPSGYTPLTVLSFADTSHSFFSGSIDIKAGGIYSLFLTGQEKAIDSVLTQDVIPVYTDSMAGVRFINLSTGSSPISVNLKGNPPTQTEFSDLAYKKASSFKAYSARKNTPTSYSFEVRNQTTGDLLTTFVWRYVRYKNNTLVITGSNDPAAQVSNTVFQIKNY